MTSCGLVNCDGCNACLDHDALIAEMRQDLFHLAAGARKELPRSSATRLFAERLLAAWRKP
ncbi:MAG: hypothetical protein IVW52_05050 [Acidimicrobiales bacterium]|nr:hypothetical protein [Acidimicrobiales bacterium]